MTNTMTRQKGASLIGSWRVKPACSIIILAASDYPVQSIVNLLVESTCSIVIPAAYDIPAWEDQSCLESRTFVLVIVGARRLQSITRNERMM
jgi:hypothetical protein